GATLTLTNSTLSGNTAQGGSGGDINGGAGQGLGGAIFNRNGTVSLTDCTISANLAAQGGRGIFNLGDAGTATATINNTIIGQSDTNQNDFTGTTINSGASTTSGVGNLIRTQT